MWKFSVSLRVSTMILKQQSFSNKLGDNIVTVTNNVLTHLVEDFRRCELFPLLHHGDTGKLTGNCRMTKVTFRQGFCR